MMPVRSGHPGRVQVHALQVPDGLSPLQQLVWRFRVLEAYAALGTTH